MKKEVIRNTQEELILTGMILNDRCLHEVSRYFDPTALDSPYSREVAKWCLEFCKKYNKAPGAHIQDIYAQKVEDGLKLDEAQADLIALFLQKLNDEYMKETTPFNSDYVLDIAHKRFASRRMKKLTDDMREQLAAGNMAEAEALLVAHKTTGLSSSRAIYPLTDAEEIRSAFEDDAQPMLHFPDALGRGINDCFVREGFVAFMAPVKRGKTFWLIETAIRAAAARNNVALFATGDMSKKQMLRRIHIRLTGKNNRLKYCGRFLVPVLDCQKNQAGECQLKRKGYAGIKHDGEHVSEFKDAPKHTPCSWCLKQNPNAFKGAAWWEWHEPNEPLSWREGLRAGNSLNKNSRNGQLFKLEAYPTRTLKVSAIRNALDSWEYHEGFVPDVIIIDYIDIMVHDGHEESRHRQNQIWMDLRALSLERHCLVVTATQSDGASLTQKTLGMDNYSEEMRKYAHATAFITLNQTEEEKVNGLMRVGTLLAREDDTEIGLVTVLGSPKIGRLCMGSFI